MAVRFPGLEKETKAKEGRESKEETKAAVKKAKENSKEESKNVSKDETKVSFQEENWSLILLAWQSARLMKATIITALHLMLRKMTNFSKKCRLPGP
jgi:hypothetical protein